MGRVGLLGLLGLGRGVGGVGKKTLANFESLPKCVAHYCSVILRHILGCASSPTFLRCEPHRLFILRSSFAHPSLKVRSRFGGILIFELGTSCKLAPAEVLTPVEGVRKVLFREGDLPIARTM